MKKIGFITTNKMLAQSLAAAVKGNPELEFEPFLLLDPQQASLDAEVLKLDVAVVDVIDGAAKETETLLSFCKRLRMTVPGCRQLLLVSQDDKIGQKMAICAMKSKTVDDFVFYDTSLEYLFAKLAAF
ncbi:hypothetical protein LJC60_09430 [Ruminococcaceae bacterium OttesenSCG-928-D13]|nr:hypothetical protein [Ruminococcaceae bacterium OttesenSCG-928-D13]